jgi:hypothetical protein
MKESADFFVNNLRSLESVATESFRGKQMISIEVMNILVTVNISLFQMVM